MIPSLSTGAVGSRFVSQDDVEVAKARRDEQWKAAYARYAVSAAGFALFCLLKSVWQARTGAATTTAGRFIRRAQSRRSEYKLRMCANSNVY